MMTNVIGIEENGVDINFEFIELPRPLIEPLRELLMKSKGIRPLLSNKPYSGYISVNQALIIRQTKDSFEAWFATLDFPPSGGQIKELSLNMYASLRDIRRTKEGTWQTVDV
jgi:hypothetical protein